MTVIATDGKSMAADSMTTAKGYLMAYQQKIHRLDDGRIVGASGPSTECAMLRRWLNDPTGERPSLSEEVVAIILEKDGSVSWVDYKFEILPDRIVPFAIGSGEDLAVGAMLAGKTPKEAIELAMTRQRDCGGEITVLFPGLPLRDVA